MTQETNGNIQLYQGDVLLEKCTSLPKKMKEIKPIDGRYTLSFGEATGHRHSIVADDRLSMYEDESGTLWLDVGTETEIEHEKGGVHTDKHAPITIKPGHYKFTQQRESTLNEEWRPVID